MQDNDTTEEKRVQQDGDITALSHLGETILRHRRLLIISIHNAVFTVALLLAFLFAFNMHLDRQWMVGPFPLLLLIALPIKLLVFGWYGQYRGWWRYVGIADLIQIAKASLFSTIILMVLWTAYGWYGGSVLPETWPEQLNERIEPLEQVVIQLRPVENELENLIAKKAPADKDIEDYKEAVGNFFRWYYKKATTLYHSREEVNEVIATLEVIDEKINALQRDQSAETLKERMAEIKEAKQRLSKIRVKLGRYQVNLVCLLDLVELAQTRQISRRIEESGLSEEERIKAEVRLSQLKGFWQQIHGVIMLDLFTTVMLLAGVRMIVRLYNEEYFLKTPAVLKRFLVIGAGDAGEALLREMMRIKMSEYHVVGFVDDDPAKQGMRIHGVTVLGAVDKLPEICTEHKIDEIGIALPSASHKQLRRVVQICQGTKIRFRTVPSITDIASGKLRVSQIRDVDINDLLGRDVVELDLDDIEHFLKGKTIFVTGAGGSIGSEMCRQVCNFEPKLLLLAEQAENPLFFIERELRTAFDDVKILPLVCDITDK